MYTLTRRSYLAKKSTQESLKSFVEPIQLKTKRKEYVIKHLFLICISYRLLSVLVTNTWFVPDEYWQSQEVAHRMIFGYGYLTWEWRVGIRSYVYPSMIAFWYKLLEILSLDNTFLLIYVSPVMHALMTATADYLLFLYVRQSHDLSIAYKTLLCRFLSWFTFYMSARSLTNNVEEWLTIFALASLSPSKKFKISYIKFHTFSFISFATRPTAAINLIPIYFYHFTKSSSKATFLKQFVLIGLCVMLTSIALDSLMYHRFIVTSFNFFLYNVYHNLSIHYGTHPWHWYLTQGLPILLTIHLIPFFICFFKCDFNLLSTSVILFNVFMYSLLAHKEFRFLSQTMPFAMIMCAHGLQWINTNYGKEFYYKLIKLMCFANLLMIILFGVVHQRAPLSVMNYFRSQMLSSSNSILFLTPCHATPFYSYLHKNVSMRFLTCEPNLNKIENYKDESEKFYNDSEAWITKNQEALNSTYIVMYERLFSEMNVLLSNHSYSICARFFNTFINMDSRMDNYLIVLCQRK